MNIKNKNLFSKMKVIILLFVVLFFGFFNCSNNSMGETKKINAFTKKIKKFLYCWELENAGFENLNNSFVFFFLKDDFFILNSKDKRIVKFNSEKKILKSYQESGQGPGGMINPYQIFLYDQDTLAVFDNIKAKVLLFDLKLNFLKELKISVNVRKIQKNNNGFAAFGDFGDKIFSKLDNNFNTVDTFLTPDRTMPFKDLYPQLLYMGYLLGNGKIVYTSWMYVKENCEANIYNLNTKEKLATLEWKHPHPPTQKDISARTNLYGSIYLGEHANFYVVYNSFSGELRGRKKNEMFLFKKNGRLHIKTNGFPYDILRADGIENNSKLLFLDNEEGISYIDLTEL